MRERLLRLVDRAGRDVAARKAGERRDVAVVLGQELRIELGRARGIALGQRRVGGLEQILGLRRRRAPLVIRSMKAVTWLSGSAPMKPSAGWPLTKAITAGIDWMPIWPGIAGCSSMFILTSLTLPLAARTTFSRTGRELLARAAPGRPEIDQHRLALRFLDHVLHEGLGRRVLDETVGGCGRGRRLLQHLFAAPYLSAGAGRNLP